MKKLFALMSAFMLLALAGCTQTQNNENEQTSEYGQYQGFNVVSLKGPTSMGIVKMMDEAKNNNYEILGTADEAATKLVKGETDIALVPANLASVLYNKTEGKVRIAGINTLGVLYVVEKGDSIKSVADLKGKKIYSTGKGTTPEYALNYVLGKNGLNPETDVNVEYVSEAAQAANEVIAGNADIAVLPQPYVATVMMKQQDLRIALDLTKEWEAVDSESSLVTGVIVVRKEIAESRKEDLNKFLDDYKSSVSFVNANTDEAAQLIEGVGIIPAATAKNALPYCNIVFIEGEEMKLKLNGYFKALYEQNNASVGGKLPDEAIYYSR